MRRCALVLIAALASACGGGAATAPPSSLPAPPAYTSDPQAAPPTTDGQTPVTTARPAPTEEHPSPPEQAEATATEPTAPAEPSEPSAPTGAASAQPRPDWLGTRVLEVGPNGFAPPQPTPPELDDRRLPPSPGGELEAPTSDDFAATVTEVPPEVLERSTWSEACPVRAEDLRYVRITYWGFDGRHHTGELLLNRAVADDVVTVFEQLHAARFPLEEVRVVGTAELDLPPTGDGNVTTAFVCRPTRGATSWSQHAYGLAVDINPFHNPYLRGSAASPAEALESDAIVLPELATSYVDRGRVRPGMIVPGDVVTTAFRSIGWGWGGDWRSLKDWMHFSADGS